MSTIHLMYREVAKQEVARRLHASTDQHRGEFAGRRGARRRMRTPAAAATMYR